MTSEAFIIAIQEYYGQVYTKAQTKYVKDWLDSKSDKWRGALFDVTLRNYSGVTIKGERYLPNIAIFESYAKLVLERVKG